MTIYAKWVEADQRFAFSTGANGGQAITAARHAELLEALAAGKVLSVDGKGAPVITDAAVHMPGENELCRAIDAAADSARSAVAGDPLRAIEYDRSAAEAKAFADAGYPAADVPRTVAAWAINGRTPRQAADSILAEAAAYTEALYRIREARLQAKEQIRALINAGQIEQAKAMANEAVTAIKAAVSGIGNNATV